MLAAANAARLSFSVSAARGEEEGRSEEADGWRQGTALGYCPLAAPPCQAPPNTCERVEHAVRRAFLQGKGHRGGGQQAAGQQAQRVRVLRQTWRSAGGGKAHVEAAQVASAQQHQASCPVVPSGSRLVLRRVGGGAERGAGGLQRQAGGRERSDALFQMATAPTAEPTSRAPCQPSAAAAAHQLGHEDHGQRHEGERDGEQRVRLAL